MASPHFKGENTRVVTEEDGKINIAPQALDIIWGADSRYWRLSTKIGDPIELLQVCWLEVSGSVELSNLKVGKEYKVSFKVAMKPDAFGWADSPVFLMAKPGKGGKYVWRSADLSGKKAAEELSIPMEKELRFVVPAGSDGNDKLLFGMYEIWKGRWKGGMVIQGVVIEPCN